MTYQAHKERYDRMQYNRCGRSGLLLPAISLGLWHNFGGVDTYENGRSMLRRAFDLGITHFDLANNYGPPPGSAEEMFGSLLKKDFAPYRDELIISSKAGYRMWDGPYGEWGSKKYLIASLDQSLKRMGLDYVDIFYSHRPDPDTPMEETIGALDQIVRQGKALYAGISSYSAPQTREAAEIAERLGTPILIHQPKYSMFDRWIEDGLQDALEENGIGSIAFCPLAQGLLTNKYLSGIPENSRAAKSTGALDESEVTPEVVQKLQQLNTMAADRGQSLAQMALAWALHQGRLTSVLIGASRVSQIEENVAALEKLDFQRDELDAIEDILN
ncbi:L-glyceraldehyde 3-phosphate reductase [Halobacillus salinarum]|uniref:L-glyceraldehyde 3-phosphate reductase n=1 Tax=Halobacillus salinarum TaxID=2932257 RepID=A0ABY4EKY3_9BACI|nr:L-glyceraldehyde 3-phosphate reductase [Halobacillus salinarum]UOQ45128.1 L-glyceraldehyde 3-phosphate reductase [Halobacillus salinarum]